MDTSVRLPPTIDCVTERCLIAVGCSHSSWTWLDAVHTLVGLGTYHSPSSTPIDSGEKAGLVQCDVSTGLTRSLNTHQGFEWESSACSHATIRGVNIQRIAPR